MRLYFVRHGESEANTRHIISNRESLFPLTSTGRQQANRLAARLQTIPFSAMFCSPVLRARETAGILSDTLHIPFQVTEALCEYDCGVLEEQGDEESWAQHHYFFTEWMLCRNLDRKPEGGESFRDIERRFVPFVESLRARNAGNMLLVGHGGLFLLMLPVLLVNIDNEFVLKHGIDHTECIIAKSHTSGWICKEWGNISL